MRFYNKYWFLSNFCDAPFVDPKSGIKYQTTEHFYQAAKTLDVEEQKAICAAPTAGKSKYLGRCCTIRTDRNDVKLRVMARALVLKFTQNPALQKKLIATGDLELVEGNTWGDTFWGVCNGVGENHLGKLLMRLRTEFVGGK